MAARRLLFRAFAVHGFGLLFTLGCVGTAHADFVDVASSPISNSNSSIGAAWGDFNDDGNLDLCLVDFNPGGIWLYRNDGGPWSTYLGPQYAAWEAAWADYDNDGDLDIFLVNWSQNVLLRNDGGTFANATPGVMVNLGATDGVAWGDFDNDGDLDLYVASAFFWPNKLMRNDGGTWVDATTGPLGSTVGSNCVRAGDFDNDGDLDLYVANNDNFMPPANKLYRNDGGSWADVTNGALGQTGESMGAAWGDYDNDGDLDLYVVNYPGALVTDVANKLLRNDNGTFVNATTPPLGDTGSGRGASWADYDNDGDLDLYLANYGGANKLFRNEGGSFVNATAPPLDDPANGWAVAWGDYDNDGDLDLYHASYSANRLFRNDDASGNHWLHLDLEGVESNRSAIGARVKVVIGGTIQIREVGGDAGLYSQNSLTVEFGLGSATAIDSLVIRWPSGIVQEVLPTPAVDQKMTITEGATVGVVDEVIGAPALEGIFPNPTRSGLVRVSLALPPGSDTRIELFDLMGRRLMSRDLSGLGPGRHVVDVRAEGRLSPGIYLVHLLHEETRSTARLVVLE